MAAVQAAKKSSTRHKDHDDLPGRPDLVMLGMCMCLICSRVTFWEAHMLVLGW
ncbi:unnamed protein product [Prunus brigantina]